ncbi:MAG: HAD hydrolase family protein [Candidatus Hadarchaeales archaeon]
MKKPSREKLKRIKLVAFDFDGVFTDNKVYVDQDGREMVCCWRSDGIGLQKLKEIGVKTVVISSEINPVVEKRCAKLGLECVTGEKNKLNAFKKILEREKVLPQEACFVGNDTPDLECMRFAGLSIAPKGSMPEVVREADYVTKNPGGRGAVREICDMIYEAKKSTTLEPQVER